jgi:hypothetical protein
LAERQIGDYETGAGVADHGVVTADFGVVEHDVIVREPAYPGGRPNKVMARSRQRVKARHGGLAGRRGMPIKGARRGGRCGECGSPYVQYLLP